MWMRSVEKVDPFESNRNKLFTRGGFEGLRGANEDADAYLIDTPVQQAVGVGSKGTDKVTRRHTVHESMPKKSVAAKKRGDVATSVSVLHWIMYTFIALTPLVNVFGMIYFLRTEEKGSSLHNWAKAMLVFIALGVLLYIIFVVLVATVWSSWDPTVSGQVLTNE